MAFFREGFQGKYRSSHQYASNGVWYKPTVSTAFCFFETELHPEGIIYCDKQIEKISWALIEIEPILDICTK